MYYNPDPAKEFMKYIELNSLNFDITSFKEIMIKEEALNIKVKKVEEEIMKIKLLRYKAELIEKDCTSEAHILRNIKNALEIYLLGWLAGEKILREKVYREGLRKKMGEKEKKEGNTIEEAGMKEAMELLLQAEDRLEETKNLITYLKGINLIKI